MEISNYNIVKLKDDMVVFSSVDDLFKALKDLEKDKILAVTYIEKDTKITDLLYPTETMEKIKNKQLKLRAEEKIFKD